jgi:hypothetical protein
MKTAPLITALFGYPSFCTAFSSPKITRDSMAGLWKLTGVSSNLPSTEKATEHYIKLNDDGSFQAVETAQSLLGLSGMQGTWDYRDDGNLILAADRPKDTDIRKVHDTILEGKVEYKQTETMQDKAVLFEEETNIESTAAVAANLETWLSVPKGSVRIGKFFYPQNHPAFFETPIFNPTNMGTFQLRQVLSSHPPKPEEVWVEKFRRDDFTKTKFWLSSYPIPDPKPKGRWSIKYGEYVQDPPHPDQKKEADEFPINIRVLQVEFYANYTFSITDGVGTEVQLRGKWDIWGDDRDLLWMQIMRFGFGRDISGSTYSEGQHLSHNDCKRYHGRIKNADVGSIQVKGEVYLGDVTPYREALFTLKEVHDDPTDEEEEDEDEEEDFKLPDSPPPPDWSDAFQ